MILSFETPEHARLMSLAGEYSASKSPLERLRISREMRAVRLSRRPSRPSLTRVFAALVTSWAETPEDGMAETLYPSPY